MAIKVSSSSRKESLRRALLSYIYVPGYKDISLFSPTYSENILKYIIPKMDTYTLISGDADKLGAFNQTYGEKQGDIALYHTLSHIHSHLSSFDPNFISLRVNMGDEVHYIYPNRSEEECSEVILSTKESLDKLAHAYPNQYLRMSFGIADSKNKTFPEVITQANKQLATDKEEKVSKTKRELQRQLIHAWDKYFNIGRLSITNLEDPAFFSKKSTELRGQLAKLMEDMDYSMHQTQNKQLEKIDETFSLNKKNPISAINHTAIHNYLMTGTDENVKETDLKLLFDSLCRNRHTHLLTKEYLEKQLMPKLESQRRNYGITYAISQFHISGLKQSNYQNGMDFTDYSLGLVANSIKKASGLSFNEKTLSIYREDNFLIDANGGNFLAITPIENIKGNSFFSKIPDSTSTNKDSESTFTTLQEDVSSINGSFHVLSRKSITSCDKDIETCIKENYLACKKESAIYHNTPQEELLSLVFSDSIESFLENHPSEESKNLFCDIAMATFGHFCQSQKHQLDR